MAPRAAATARSTPSSSTAPTRDDFVQIASLLDGIDGSPPWACSPLVSITGAEATNDDLTVNALGGNDTVDASNLPANLIGLALNGGAGNDTILGSQGDDLVNGGPGDDMAEMGDGDDTFVWNPGDGSDTVDGQGGSDRMVFNGSDAAENFDISANGNRVRLHPRRRQCHDGPRRHRDDRPQCPRRRRHHHRQRPIRNRPHCGQPEPGQLRRAAATARPTPSSSTAPTATTYIQIAACRQRNSHRRHGPVCPGEHHRRGGERTTTLTVNALGGNDMVDASTCPPI